MARFGYESLVVEAEASDLPPESVPFTLRSISPRGAHAVHPRSGGGAQAPAAKKSGLRQELTALMQRVKNSPLGPPLVFSRFLVDYGRRYILRPLKRLPDASVYYLHAPYQFPAVYLKARGNRARIVYDAHDFYSDMTDPNAPKRPEVRWMVAFHRLIERACIARADMVVTVSDGIAELLKEAFDCNPIVVRNCHDARLDHQRVPALRDALGLAPDAFLLVTIGNAKDGRAIDEALDAMQTLPEHVHLALLGRSYERFAGEIAGRGLEERVHVVPPVRPSEVVPFVRSADAALVLYYALSVNIEYCLPNGFFQAIAAELPLLYPELTEIRRLSETYGVGLPIVPREAASIEAGVLALLSQSCAERQALRERLAVASDALSWEREELRLRDMLDHLTRARSDAAPAPAS